MASLQNIRIASPCPADWETMSGDDRVRRCSECNLNVYNLSAMTAKEAEVLLSSHSGTRLCARFYRRADGTILTQDCPWSLEAIKRRTLRIASAILAATISMAVAFTKPRPQQSSQTVIENHQQESTIRITITDQTGAVISGAKVMLRLKTKGRAHPVAQASTDNFGFAEFKNVPEGSYRLTFEAQHFKKMTRTVDLKTQQSVRLTTQLRVEDKGAVMVEVGGITVDSSASTSSQVTVLNLYRVTALASLRWPPAGGAV